jgi:hypothetical protein
MRKVKDNAKTMESLAQPIARFSGIKPKIRTGWRWHIPYGWLEMT